MDALGHDRFAVVGHDTGFAISYALAADHPDRVDRVALAEIPGPPAPRRSPPLFVPAPVNNRLWHIPFNRVENAARAARSRAARTSSSATSSPSRAATLPDEVIDYYVALLSRARRRCPAASGSTGPSTPPWPRTTSAASQPLTMPVLAIGGEASYGDHVGDAMQALADDVQGVVIAGAGHWVAEEAPEELLAALTHVPGPVPGRPVATPTLADQSPRVIGARGTPVLGGATEWLNTEPLGPAELRGHVVLVNFWTLTCINWLRTEPLRPGLGRCLPRRRTGRHRGPHPGVLLRARPRPRAAGDRGPSGSTTRSRSTTTTRSGAPFDNHYWPALYFVDARRRHPRPALRRGTLRALRAAHPAAARHRSATSSPSRRSASRRRPTGTTCCRPRPTSGTAGPALRLIRGRRKFDEPQAYELPRVLPLNHWALAGVDDADESAVLDRAGGTIAFRFHARDAHLVLARGAEPDPVPRPPRRRAPGPSHGSTSTRRATACSTVAACTSSCASTTRSASDLEITFLEPGVEAYAFTFG